MKNDTPWMCLLCLWGWVCFRTLCHSFQGTQVAKKLGHIVNRNHLKSGGQSPPNSAKEPLHLLRPFSFFFTRTDYWEPARGLLKRWLLERWLLERWLLERTSQNLDGQPSVGGVLLCTHHPGAFGHTLP